MKEIILDLAEATREQYPTIDLQLVDFGVPLPLPVLKFVCARDKTADTKNRSWDRVRAARSTS